ncbi:MAG: DUF429 domain-containing protein [Betaproteobacteria bacterium]|nr:DUF429 domain-containing protein [Betaproteobacteria bacterium]
MTRLLGCDFSSSPTKHKNIVLAWGAWRDQRLVIDHLQACTSLDDFAQALHAPGPWVGGFDLPFGLPRELVNALSWPQQWRACIDHYAGFSRAHIRELFKAFCDARPAGRKFAHRATDMPAGSSPSMKWVNPPVAYMLHVGVPLMLKAGLDFPGLSAGDASRVALEAYPGWLARQLIGSRSYKSDDKAKQTPERLIARKDILQALVNGHQGVSLYLRPAQHDDLVQDASGDKLDAVLCMVQAAVAQQHHERGDKRYGLPLDMDPLEGWIIGV